jgi:DNA-binding response OmpR family regulator
MNIFILEDSKDRLDLLNRILINSFGNIMVCSASNPRAAIEWIGQFDFDLIMLDFDLGKDSNGQITSIPVAQVIPDSINKDTPVIIHSADPVGAEQLKGIIGDTAQIVSIVNGIDNLMEYLKTIKEKL